ncbi:MAG: cytochrome C [Planctomycetes bacterium]|nr:cytochrome C [Planctomycetota bacterium]
MNRRRAWLSAGIGICALIWTETVVSQAPAGPPAQKPPERLDPEQSCITSECHTGYATGPFVHGPTALGMCRACHESVAEGRHAFRMVRQGAELCAFCHDPLPAREHLHGPVSIGLCTACHDPHRSDHPFMLREAPGAPLCFQCHEPSRFQGHSHVHAPVVAGQCLQCHDPHSSDHPAVLRKASRELCLSCHSEFREAHESRSHWHAPAREDCTRCHDAHASDHRKQLAAEIPDLCWTCHSDLRDQFAHSTNIHKATEIEDKCLNCHDAHASRFPKVLKKDQLTLCLSCHDRPIEVGAKRPLLNMKKEIEEAKFLHGPILQGNCSACHRPHAASTFRRLVDVFPAEFYAPFDLEQYGLCFKCHDKQLVLEGESTTLTGFRNGSENLHFFHVNKEKKGRTCRACHAIHGSQHPFHIRDTVPFGGWDIPINFEKTETGGSCAPGCHSKKEYDRVNPVTKDQK